jgi:hypothetical protein
MKLCFAHLKQHKKPDENYGAHQHFMLSDRSCSVYKEIVFATSCFDDLTGLNLRNCVAYRLISSSAKIFTM